MKPLAYCERTATCSSHSTDFVISAMFVISVMIVISCLEQWRKIQVWQLDSHDQHVLLPIPALPRRLAQRERTLAITEQAVAVDAAAAVAADDEAHAYEVTGLMTMLEPASMVMAALLVATSMTSICKVPPLEPRVMVPQME